MGPIMIKRSPDFSLDLTLMIFYHIIKDNAILYWIDIDISMLSQLLTDEA